MPARVETRGRARALQALYAWDVRGEEDLLRIASMAWDDLQVLTAQLHRFPLLDDEPVGGPKAVADTVVGQIDHRPASTVIGAES